MAEPDYVALNRENWTRANAEYTDAAAREGWEREEVLWGQWHQPDSEVGALRDVAGKDLVELGCRFHRAWYAEDGSAFYAVANWDTREGAGEFFQRWDITDEPGEVAIPLMGDVGLVPVP